MDPGLRQARDKNGMRCRLCTRKRSLQCPSRNGGSGSLYALCMRGGARGDRRARSSGASRHLRSFDRTLKRRFESLLRPDNGPFPRMVMLVKPSAKPAVRTTACTIPRERRLCRRSNALPSYCAGMVINGSASWLPVSVSVKKSNTALRARLVRRSPCSIQNQ